MAGAPKESILGSFPFNVYIYYHISFHQQSDFRQTSDDTTICLMKDNPKSNQAILSYNFKSLP